MRPLSSLRSLYSSATCDLQNDTGQKQSTRQLSALKRDLWHVGAIEGGDLTKIDKAARGSAKQEKQAKRRLRATAHANGQHYLPLISSPVAKTRE